MDVRVTETAPVSDAIAKENTCVIMNGAGKFLSVHYGDKPSLFWGRDIAFAVKGKDPGKVRYCARRNAEREGKPELFDTVMAEARVCRAMITTHREVPRTGGKAVIDHIRQIEEGMYIGVTKNATRPSQAVQLPAGAAGHARVRVIQLTPA